MATYKIAPDSTGEIGMAQMKYGLVNKADYNNSNGVTTEVNMNTLVVNSTSYQGDLTSKTWDTSQPFSFAEMYGQTWNDQTPFTLAVYAQPQTNNNCSAFTATVKKNGTVVKTISKTSGNNPVFSPTGQTFSVVDTDVILIEVSFANVSGVGCVGNFSETTVDIKTGSTVFNWTTKSSGTGTFGDSFSYQFTASLAEANVDLNHTPIN